MLSAARTRLNAIVMRVALISERLRRIDERARALHVADRVRALVLDYRDLGRLGPFDAVASIGMFEHVGGAMLPAYFAAAHRALRPGGLFLNHGIATAAMPQRRLPTLRFGADFIGRHVFPDGELVTVSEAVARAERACFELIHAESLRPHYALTLAEWVRRLESARETARSIVEEEIYRTWRLYMAGSRVGFERHELDVAQLLLARRDEASSASRGLRPSW